MEEIAFMGDTYEVVSDPFRENGQSGVWAYTATNRPKSHQESRTDPFVSYEKI